ncbi:uncharacterized protein DUF892 [Paraburkholderia sp. BL6665CI2N2]|nr:uncharacterized protein DUF892 [Paraburkholderia sp. BL6665CI2N2]
MPARTLKDLFIHSLSDIYSAEKQMTESLLAIIGCAIWKAHHLLSLEH